MWSRLNVPGGGSISAVAAQLAAPSAAWPPPSSNGLVLTATGARSSKHVSSHDTRLTCERPCTWLRSGTNVGAPARGCSPCPGAGIPLRLRCIFDGTATAKRLAGQYQRRIASLTARGKAPAQHGGTCTRLPVGPGARLRAPNVSPDTPNVMKYVQAACQEGQELAARPAA